MLILTKPSDHPLRSSGNLKTVEFNDVLKNESKVFPREIVISKKKKERMYTQGNPYRWEHMISNEKSWSSKNKLGQTVFGCLFASLQIPEMLDLFGICIYMGTFLNINFMEKYSTMNLIPTLKQAVISCIVVYFHCKNRMLRFQAQKFHFTLNLSYKELLPQTNGDLSCSKCFPYLKIANAKVDDLLWGHLRGTAQGQTDV